MTLGSNLLLSSILDMFYNLESKCELLARNYSPSFCEAAFTPDVCCSLHTPFPMETSCHQLPTSLQMSSTPFACWQWVPGSACDCWSGGSPGSLRRALHWAANTSAICCTGGCSHASATRGALQVTAVNVLRLMLFLLRKCLATLCQNQYELVVTSWNVFFFRATLTII